jgi:hypothetical protein
MLRTGLIAVLLLGLGSTAMASDRVRIHVDVDSSFGDVGYRLSYVGGGRDYGRYYPAPRGYYVYPRPYYRPYYGYSRGYYGGRHWHDRRFDRRHDGWRDGRRGWHDDRRGWRWHRH